MEIKVNCHSSIQINKTIYIDPLNIDEKTKATYIFITHPHWDHFSVEDINKVLTSSTKIICPQTMQKEVEKDFNNSIIYVEPNREYIIDNLVFETFNSYNIDKQFHPKDNLWVGYNINIDGEKIAVVGDSDYTPELKQLKTDVLLIPIGGTYTMNYKQAAELTNIIKPSKVIPTHYGKIVGNKNMGQDFKKLINNDIDCDLQV